MTVMNHLTKGARNNHTYPSYLTLHKYKGNQAAISNHFLQYTKELYTTKSQAIRQQHF